MKSRFCYILFSFLCTFAVAYFNSTWLLYLFLLSYFNVNKDELETGTVALPSSIDTNFQTTNKIYGIQNTAFGIENDSSITAIPKQIKFIFTDVHEAFSSTIFICLIFSFFVVAPLIFYMCFAFFRPSLYKSETRKISIYLISFSLFWIIFVWLVQFVLLPKLCLFFLQFKVESCCLVIGVETRINSYLDWVIGVFTALTAVFMLISTFIFFVINYKIDPFFLSSKRFVTAWFLLVSAAFFSPPDVVSELLFAIVLFWGFELLLLFLFVYNQSVSKKNSA